MQTYIPHRCGGRNKGVARWAWRTHQHAQLVKKKGGNVQPDNLFPNPSGCNRRSRIIKRTRVLCRKKERIKDERSCLLGWLGGWPFFGWGGGGKCFLSSWRTTLLLIAKNHFSSVLVFLNKYFSGSTAAGPFPHPQFPFSGVHTWRIRALNVRCVNSLNQKTNKLNNPSAECRGFSASAVVALMAVLRNRGSISGKASQ